MIGAGALGCAAARTLAQDRSVAIALVDDDRVELSNLQRQVLYEDADIGRLKVEAAAALLEREFGADVGTVAARFDAYSGPRLVAACDIVIDATDDPASKFLIGRLCVAANKPYVYAGVARTGGQWMLVDPGESACLECVFAPHGPGGPAASEDSTGQHAPVSMETAEGCAALGILAPVAGLVGAMQAIAALAFLRRPGRAKAGRLYIYDLMGARARHVDFMPAADCFCSAPGRYEQGEIAS